MKRLALPSLIAVLCLWVSPPAQSATARYDYIELLPALGSLQMWQSNTYISLDSALAPRAEKEHTLEECTVDTAFFNALDYVYISWQWLSCNHPEYFVSVWNEAPTAFSVYYNDNYHLPAPGYPKVVYWDRSENPPVSLSMDLVSADPGGYTYSKEVSLLKGHYQYKYLVLNDCLNEEYSIGIASFVVSERPSSCSNTGITQGSSIVNGRVFFRWEPPVQADEGFTYALHLGTDPGHLQKIYEGTVAYFEATSLDVGAHYYWRIEAINRYGVSSLSPVYQFSTIASPERAYTYPNPFNPAIGQLTHIVFSLPASGDATITIFSEYGDECWKKHFSGLPPGVNEIPYNGTDDNGRLLYNGSYVCMIQKHCLGRVTKERCRILVIK